MSDDLVAELDGRLGGARRRSVFIAGLIRGALDDQRRWDDVESALGASAGVGHEWDRDPADWVRAQRSDARRAG